MKQAQLTRRQVRVGIAAVVAFVPVGFSGLASAQTKKTFIDYLRPTPVTCSPLSSASWGVAGVLPRDLCNGIESHKGAAVPPEFYYWDGQIIRAKDGKYHMFMSTWSGSAGFNPGWTGSDAFHAISSQGVLGPYERQDYVYSNNGSHRGHNVSAVELPDGTYAVVVSETVPFTIYQASSLAGPWKGCQASIQANGINYGSDANFASNVSLFPRHDGKYEIVQRHGLIGIADSLCGPYKLQKPTWAYPAANRPSYDTIYPKRTSIPGVTNPTFAWEEDPHIWRSGGVYHVLYSGSGDRVGWHLYSTDGINNWTDDGLAFNPRLYQKIFCYEGGTTCSQWYKMERPGVVLQDGHPTHITWAVADVDKDNQIPANSNHGSKVIVVPFDGVAFDNDFGTGSVGGAGAGGASSSAGGASSVVAGGSSSAGGSTAAGGSSTGGVTATIGGADSTGGTVAIGGSNATGRTTTTVTATGGAVSTGGAPGGNGTNTAGQKGYQVGGGSVGGESSTLPVNETDTDSDGGCGCRTAGGRQSSTGFGIGIIFGALVLRSVRRTRRHR
jgi:hypothetical protein